MDKTSVVAEDTVSSDEHIVCDGISEDFNTQSVSDDFFGLLVKIWMNEGNVIVASDTVS